MSDLPLGYAASLSALGYLFWNQPRALRVVLRICLCECFSVQQSGWRRSCSGRKNLHPEQAFILGHPHESGLFRICDTGCAVGFFGEREKAVGKIESSGALLLSFPWDLCGRLPASLLCAPSFGICSSGICICRAFVGKDK